MDERAQAFPTLNRRRLERSPSRQLPLRPFALIFFSYWPSCDYPYHTSGFELKDNLEPSASNRFAEELVAITITLVSPDFKVREEAFDCFLK